MKLISLPGFPSYEEVRILQHELVEKRARGEVEDTVLFLEHRPVITRGRGLQFKPSSEQNQPRQMPLGSLPEGIEFSESERGGDLTYHGPGQLVVYPIFKLDGEGFAPHHDVAGFLRKLERIFIVELESLGLAVRAVENATGVWVGDKKVASIGIAVRKWVTYHGIAINVVNDLSPFQLISPCGFSSDVMTRLVDLLPGHKELNGSGWRTWLEARLEERLITAS